MTTSTVFLSLPLQGVRLDAGVYDAIANGIRAAGLVLLNKEVLHRPPPTDELRAFSGNVVHEHNRALLASADLVITEISRPSLGVGYEIALAEAAGKPTLALCREDAFDQLSLMIKGITQPRFSVASYSDISAIPLIVADFARRPWQSRTPLDASLTRHFDELADNYDDSTEWRRDRQLLDWFSESLAACSVCLDLGTGTGLVAATLRTTSTYIVGLDRSPGMLRLSARWLDAALQGNAEELPFRDRAFDGVAMRSLLHYVDDTRMLKEIRRVLKEGGVLACAQATGLSVADASWWEQVKRRTQPLRLRFYTDALLKRRLEDAGLSLKSSMSLWIHRKESWAGFLRHCSPPQAEVVRTLVSNIPPSVRSSIRLDTGRDGLSHRQHWTLVTAVSVNTP